VDDGLPWEAALEWRSTVHKELQDKGLPAKKIKRASVQAGRQGCGQQGVGRAE